MTTEEQRLSEWLQRETPAPPASIDLTSLIDRSREDLVSSHRPARPPRRWAPLLAAAAAIAVLAAVLAALPGRGHQSSPATHRPTPTVTGQRSTPTPAPTATPAALTFRPWDARLTTELPLHSLVPIGSSLYGYDNEELIRLEPSTGRVLARRHVPTDDEQPVVLSAGRLWVVSQSSAAPVVITAYDPLTLRQLGRYGYPIVGLEVNGLALAAGGSSTLYVGAGSRVYTVDARSGRLERTVDVANGMSAVAVSPDGTRVIVASGPNGSQVIAQLDARTGAVLAREPQAGNCYALTATAGGYFVTCGSGSADSIRFRPYSGALAVQESTGGGGVPAVASISGGVAWFGSLRQLACADPDTGRIKARLPIADDPGAPQPAVISDFSVIGGRLYATYSGVNSNDAVGLVELTPPSACGLR